LALLDLRSHLSNSSGLDTFVTQADRVDRIVADPTTGLSPAIQSFYDAIQAVADDPGAIAPRQALFSQTDLVIERFKILDNQLNDQRISINSELTAVADQVTTLGVAIAEINTDIIRAVGSSVGTALPNDLLDKRDQLINDLSELIKVTVVEQQDGAANVFIGNGQTLVIGTTSNVLSTDLDPGDPLNRRVMLSIAGYPTAVTNELVGGKLGGLVDYRNELLTPAINRLGLVAMGLASTINDQHNLGIDLNGNLGGDFFSDINGSVAQGGRVGANTENTSTATISMYIEDVNFVSVDNFRLEYVAGTTSFNLLNLTDNTSTSLAVPATPPADGSISVVNDEGFRLDITGIAGLVDGDTWLLTPTRQSVGILEKNITDLTQIAAASPIVASSSMSNSGTAEITGISVTDTDTTNTTAFGVGASQALTPPLMIVFTSDTTYDIREDDGTSTGTALIPAVTGLIYTPNIENNMLDTLTIGGLPPGYDITISGASVAGDTFSIGYNLGGIGDNSNALLMAV